MTFDDLKKLRWTWNSSSCELRPDWDVVEDDFEGATRHELSLEHVAKEEGHHDGEKFIFNRPSPEHWLSHSEKSKDVVGGHDERHEEILGDENDTLEVNVESWRIVVATMH